MRPLGVLLLLVATAARGEAQRPLTVTVDGRRTLARYRPSRVLGAGVDGHAASVLAGIYTPPNIRAMRSVGLPRLTYRLRTELGIEAWHWNPRGRWSDPVHERGYWTSDTVADGPLLTSFGYRLPRRGNTIDQAENEGYSRLDDGDTATFWKSDPYLDRRFTGEDDTQHPQWVIVDLGRTRAISAMRIAWGEPHASTYRVQYWRGVTVNDVDENPPGRWATFPGGSESAGAGGDELRRLGPSPVRARFVRIVMSASSRTALPGSSDPRDSLGYAIREIAIGTLDGHGALHDVVRHGTSRTTQSVTYASSTDPWHRAEDLDSAVAQPGFDRVLASGLTNGLPAMLPVPVLFGIPEDAAAELRFLERRRFPIERLELGEEPDGQYVAPEDFAALYAQTARALRTVDSSVPLGGPSFQGLDARVMFAWPGDSAGAPWMTRFFSELRRVGRPGDFSFVSFEWYPFDDICAPTAPQLRVAPRRLLDGLRRLEAEGVPPTMPKVIAEYGYSAFAAQAQVSLPGALLDADIVGTFLGQGGSAAYLYGYEPTELDREPSCDAWGNNALFLSTPGRRIRYRLATYFAMRMLTHHWLQPGDGEHAQLLVTTDAPMVNGDPLVTAYAVRRPDGTRSVMLINKDPVRAYAAHIKLGPGAHLAPLLDEWQLSTAEYRWHPDGPRGHPSPDGPELHRPLRSKDAILLPPYSLTVLSER